MSAVYRTAAGSPGPFDTKTPSGRRSRMSLAEELAGTTVSRHPESARQRRMLRLMPQSTTTTCLSFAGAVAVDQTPRPSVQA